MWQIYDELINSIPEDLTVVECMLGASWTLVRTEQGVGIAKTVNGGKKGTGFQDITGKKLKELAEYSKSWNMHEASLGMAAINAAFNNPRKIKELTGEAILKSENHEINNVFKILEKDITGKKVAVIGHFPEIENMKDICELAILEREPQPGDYPDSACEYLLPEQDIVFITGTAFTNKTMPKLIQLSKKSKIVLVGPSVPISKSLFNHGISLIGSFVILDEKHIWRAVQEGKKMNIFKRGGAMICLQL